ncbi:F0F1 ATP synthase subunit B [Candidatus Kinetoplastibacterium sorsogonicusi]|nr:F0F1 ATP synthase subunit B [Candidatus Kinetoplastibacterium sorsogonicusi]
MKFVWPPIIKAIDERRQKVSKALLDAEKIKVDLIEAEKKIAIMHNQAQLDIKKRYAEVEKKITVMLEKAKIDANYERSKLLDHTQKEIEQMINNNRNLLREELSKLVILGAEKILKREVDVKIHSDLISTLKSQL